MLNFKNAQDFLTELQNSDIGRTLLCKRESTQRAERQTQVDRLHACRQELDETVKMFTTALAPIERAHREAVEKEQAAARKLLAKRKERSSAVHTLEYQIDQLERGLRVAADPSIDDALSALTNSVEAIGRDGFRYETVRTGNFSMDTMKPIVKVRTNQANIERIMDAVRAARHKLDTLKIENPEDLAGAIAAIHASVPWDSAYEVEEVA